MRRTNLTLGLLVAVSLAACTGSTTALAPATAGPDAGQEPSFTQPDPLDGGPAGDDGGPPVPPLDAGPSAADSGAAEQPPADAGSLELDLDAGPPPRADVPALACSDALSMVATAPANLPPMADTHRGDVVRCALDTQLDLAEVQAEAASKSVATPMVSAVALYRVAFRTTRGDGSEGLSTARVYLPQQPRALPLPVIVVGHPTVGLADACAPSADPASNRDLALPWAGLGYAVIVPDYAGLGTDGAQAYLDNRDQGFTLLDGARALRKLLDPGALGPHILAVGYSQGGGAVLSAQALARSYGADGELVGAIVFAPEWPTRMNSFGLVDMLRNPNALTIQTGISENVVQVLRTYAYFYNRVGAAHAGDGFPAANRAGIVNAVESLCQTPLGGYLQGTAYRVGDTMDASLRNTLLACVEGGEGDPGCVEPGRSFHAFLTQNVLAADPNGARVLYVQGLADYVMPAASEAACNIQKLEADGVTPQLCVDPGGQHQTVVSRNIDFALGWGQALLEGGALPTCSSSGMPACVP